MDIEIEEGGIIDEVQTVAVDKKDHVMGVEKKEEPDEVQAMMKIMHWMLKRCSRSMKHQQL